MRRLAAVAGALVGAAVIGAVVGVVLLNRLLAERADEIVAGISDGFARPVTIARIAAGLHGGAAIELRDMVVAEDPAFGTEPFLRAPRVHVVLRLLPLLRGRFEVRRVVAVEPVIRVVRTPAGMNVDSVGRRQKDPPPHAAPEGAGASEGRRRESARTAALGIALFNLDRATVQWVDLTGPKPNERTISPLSLHLTDVSLTAPVGYDLHATIEGTEPTTLAVRGTVGPVGDPPFATDVPIEQHVTIDAATLDVPELVLTGTLRRDDDGRPVANLRLAAGTIESEGVTVTDLSAVAREGAQTATLDQLSLRAFGGTLSGTGRIGHAVSPVGVALQTTVRDVDVALVAARAEEHARFRGRLDADWSVAATGDDEVALRRSVAGTGRVVIRDGAVHGINLPEGVLSGVTSLAGVASLIPPKVRNRYPDVFATDDTRFERLTADVRLADERVIVDAVVITARDFEVRGAGVVTFGGRVDLDGTLATSPALWSDIVGVLKELRVLGGADGRLTIPFHVSGTMPKVRVKPDDAFVGRTVEKLVGAVMGGGREGRKAKDDAEQLIRKGLDKLLRR